MCRSRALCSGIEIFPGGESCRFVAGLCCQIEPRSLPGAGSVGCGAMLRGVLIATLPTKEQHRVQRLTTYIIISMILGIGVGYMCHELWPDPRTARSIAEYISLFTDVFLRLIKMIIAPLVFSTLVVGVAHMGDTKAVGRIGGKAMLWFVSASLVSLLLGLVLVNLLAPGDNLNLPLPDANSATNLKVAALSVKDFVAHLVPRSVVEAMATNEILQIVVFSLFFGVACA